jgi:hypothetical protein
VVDTQGNLLAVVVHSAGSQDRPELHWFKILPKRWIVQRTLPWLVSHNVCPKTNYPTPRRKP